MSFSFLRKNPVRYVALLDIGSGSVLSSIIASDSQKAYPEIIWSHREHTILKQSHTATDSAKSILTSLVNALITLESEGKATLRNKYPHTHLTELMVTIAAPWSYTAVKTISYNQEEPFVVTETLINDLIETAHRKVEEELLEHERVSSLGLSVISRSLLQVIANGYVIVRNNNQSASTLKLIEASAVAQDNLVTAVIENKEKTLPNAELSITSFMIPFFYSTQSLAAAKNLRDYLLVDITYEATEIGVVRDGALLYCTHAIRGSFSIARDIAEALGIPTEEAYGYLRSQQLEHYMETYSEAKQGAVKDLLTAYEDTLCGLFKETGDNLAIPRTIFIHGDLATEEFFNTHVKAAAKLATNSDHAVHNVSADMLSEHYTEAEQKNITIHDDSALLIAAHFFHTNQNQTSLTST